jgi:hypothetical protein
MTHRTADQNARMNLLAQIRTAQERLGIQNPVHRKRLPEETLRLQLALLEAGHRIADPVTLLDAHTQPHTPAHVLVHAPRTPVPAPEHAPRHTHARYTTPSRPAPAESGEHRLMLPPPAPVPTLSTAVISEIAQAVATAVATALIAAVRTQQPAAEPAPVKAAHWALEPANRKTA